MKKIPAILLIPIVLLLPLFCQGQVQVVENGDVGIGTQTPSVKLDVIGKIKSNTAVESPLFHTPFNSVVSLMATANSPYYGYAFRIIDTYNGGWARNYGSSYYGDTRLSSLGTNGSGSTLNYMYFDVSSSDPFWQTTDMILKRTSTGANLGLGVLSPNALLHIKSTQPYSNNIKMESGGNYWTIEKGQAGYSTQALSFVYNGNKRALRLLSGTDAEFFSTRIRTSANTIFVDPATNYNVGFGSATPAADTRVHISGKTNSSGTFSFKSDSQLGLHLGMAIRDDGKVGVGLTDMSAKLHIQSEGTGSSTDAFIVENANEDDLFHIEDSGNIGIGMSNPTEKLDIAGNVKASGSVMASCGTLSCSDIRYKENFKKLESSLAKIQLIDGLYYDWKKDAFPEKGFDDKTYLGFKAQEVEQQFPEIVHTDSDGYKSVDYSRMTVVLLEGIKEQQMQLNKQEEQINILQHENELLKNQMTEVLKYIKDQSENTNTVANENNRF